jgi:hypothetical protein
VKKLKRELQKLIAMSLYDLMFDYDRNQAFQVELLVQRPIDEINRYLEMKAEKLRATCGKKHTVIPEAIYLVVSQADNGSITYGYMRGISYFLPKTALPSRQDLRKMWCYSLSVASDGVPYQFDSFVEKRINRALSELRDYERMLDADIFMLEYALLSDDGMQIHGLLQELASRKAEYWRHEIHVFRANCAPECMVQDAELRFHEAQMICGAIEAAKPRVS